MSGIYNQKKGVSDSGDSKIVVDVASANGAITIPDRGDKVVVITKGTAAALTLTAPTATVHDGVIIEFVSTTAAAHTITATTVGFNAGSTASDVCTFSAAIGNSLRIVAYQGGWYVLNNVNGTLA